MKKIMMILAGVCLGATSQAAITAWSAGLSTTTGYTGGAAYFLEVKEGGPTLAAMIASIKNSGLGTASTTTVTLLASGTLGSNSAFNTDTLSIAESSTSSYYTLFVDSTKQNFVFSAVGKIGDEVMFFEGSLTPMGEKTYGGYFNEVPTTDNWSENGGAIGSTSGGDTPGGNVPEPTVFALLALGVAGVALRRKTK